MNEAWLPKIGSAAIKYQAIADALGNAIESGALRAGERLPPQRDLANRLGVDLTTVTKAYDAVRQKGLIEARGRAGSFVREARLVDIDDRREVDGGMNMPPELPGKLLERAIAETTSTLLLSGSPLRLQYQRAGGSTQDRAIADKLLTRRGFASEPQQLLIAAGGQNALHAVLSAITRPGDRIACGRHVYPGFRAAAERRSVELVALDELTADGLRAAHAERALKALYVVPTNDNPTTTTLDAGERKALADALDELGVQVIEDDAYGALCAQPRAPIASIAPHLGWYIASTSKIISPALRVAFVRAPSAVAALRLSAEIHESAIMAPPLNAAAVSQWIVDGTYDRLLDCMRSEIAHRRSIAAEVLAGLDYQSHPQGYHLWLRLPDQVRPRDLADLMRPTGLSVIAGEQFAVGTAAAHAVRVSLGGLTNHAQLRQGLAMLHHYATSPGLRSGVLI